MSQAKLLTTETIHPLEPLTEDEIRNAVDIVKSDKRVPVIVRFASVTLKEPTKSRVLQYSEDEPDEIPREAVAILLDRDSGDCVEATIDLGSRKVINWNIRHNVQPPIMLDEFVECEEAVKSSPLFIEALEKRGIKDLDLVMVDPWSAGSYGIEPESDKGRRLSRALSWLRTSKNDNGYARPIEGLVAVVDLNKMEIVRIEDEGVTPLPPESGNWSRQFIEPRNGQQPIEITQPQGPSFTVEGHKITWQKWQFRFAFDAREGLVLYRIGYEDEGVVRPIIYRASVCDMVVPYGDPGEIGFRKNAFDIGEYGMGQLANPLTLGCDCLGHIQYFDAPMVNSLGELATIKNAVCLHEEDDGILWKHTDWRTEEVEVRRSRRLVISFVATVGNYEYGFYWYFYQDGSLQLEVKLTGIVNTTALKPGETSDFGTEIAPQLNAPYHQHVFNARLDMNVDGQQNSVVEMNTNSVEMGHENPHGNAFKPDSRVFKRELDAQRLCDSSSSRYWKITNNHNKNMLGEPVSYRLIPGENAITYANDKSAVMKRAGFMKKHLWVTPYEADERFAAGDYPNQRKGGDGLPEWTEKNRSISDEDIIVWYTFGHTHIPRPEDWPVMPVHKIGFMLKPDGFFGSNPSLDVPPTAEISMCCDDSCEEGCLCS